MALDFIVVWTLPGLCFCDSEFVAVGELRFWEAVISSGLDQGKVTWDVAWQVEKIKS